MKITLIFALTVLMACSDPSSSSGSNLSNAKETARNAPGPTPEPVPEPGPVEGPGPSDDFNYTIITSNLHTSPRERFLLETITGNNDIGSKITAACNDNAGKIEHRICLKLLVNMAECLDVLKYNTIRSVNECLEIVEKATVKTI